MIDRRTAAEPPHTDTHVVVGAGPLARAVSAALVARGVQPSVITRSGAAIAGASHRAVDVTTPAFADALQGAQVVIQCAQPPYHRWPEEFPRLQAAVADAAAAAGALLVVADNLYGYGPVAGKITEDRSLVATTRKGAVRASMWHNLEDAHRTGRLQVVAGRGSDFFGPGVEASAVGARFVGALCKGRAASVLGDPDVLHTYTFVSDFGEALVRLSETPSTWGRAWHVPNAPTGTTRELAEAIARAAGCEPARVRPMPTWQLRLGGMAVPALREMIEMRYEFDGDLVVDHSAYAAAIGDHATPLPEAIAMTVAANG